VPKTTSDSWAIGCQVGTLRTPGALTGRTGEMCKSIVAQAMTSETMLRDSKAAPVHRTDQQCVRVLSKGRRERTMLQDRHGALVRVNFTLSP
jgi:hypothetical protein